VSKRPSRKALHPGEILKEQFMAEFGLSINKVARDLRVPPTRISEIVNERRGVSADTAIRLARYFGTTPEFWMNLQTAYDLDVSRSSVKQIAEDVKPLKAA
jgi:addiction module HigA family antidote